MTTYRLDESASATFNASGIAEATITVPGNQQFRITRYAVVTSQGVTTAPFPFCTVYVNSVADSNVFDQTYSGHRDQSDADLVLMRSQRLIARWTGGIAGTVGTLSVFGEKETL